MHSWFVLLLFGCLLFNATSRPQQAEYTNDSDIEEAEEEDDNEAVAESYAADDEDSRINDKQETSGQEVPQNRHLLDLADGKYMTNEGPADQAVHPKVNSLANININRNRDVREENQSEPAHYNEQTRNFVKRRQSVNNRYTEASDEQQQETQQHLNVDVSKSNNVPNPEENQINKRTLEYAAANEEGDMIFDKARDPVNRAKNEYNANEGADSDQSRYIKQYYNKIPLENRDITENKNHEGARFKLRDRRDTKEENQPDSSNSSDSTEINDKSETEDEETAIKRHIKKLTSEELNQLLSSLTEEKRELLKKIIDDSDHSENLSYLNKREITKKAGAVEENNYIENCQSDISKIQGDSSSLDLNTESPSSASTEPTEISSKQQDTQVDISETAEKTSESNFTSNKLDIASHNDDELQKKTDNSLNGFAINMDPKNQADNIVANVQVTSSKSDHKREVNLEDVAETDESVEDKIAGQEYPNDQGYINAQDENLSNLLEEENQPMEERNYKREAFYDKQAELSDPVKSLEESFPRSNAYDDLSSYSGPLVRVKRKTHNQVIKKRSAGLLPDAKVAYFPYKAENDDEDNDEGNEFDDEGFYDRTSNFDSNNKGLEQSLRDKADDNIQTKDADVSKSLNENIESNTSLGSDSDSVLSGVEGVDDNLMYSSGARSRRTAEDNPNENPETKIKDRSTLLMEEEAKPIKYQEHDSFGPLPRNSDGGLVRYKRIRRVKELHSPHDRNTPQTE